MNVIDGIFKSKAMSKLYEFLKIDDLSIAGRMTMLSHVYFPTVIILLLTLFGLVRTRFLSYKAFIILSSGELFFIGGMVLLGLLSEILANKPPKQLLKDYPPPAHDDKNTKVWNVFVLNILAGIILLFCRFAAYLEEIEPKEPFDRLGYYWYPEPFICIISIIMMLFVAGLCRKTHLALTEER